MQIYFILIPFIVLLGILLGSKDTLKNRGIYICTCSLIFLLISSLRNLNVGNIGSDAWVYYQTFQAAHEMTFFEIWQKFILRYWVGGESEIDIGYLLFEKIGTCLTDDFHVFTFIAQLLFFIPFGRLLYKYSNSMKEVIFAFIFFIALLYSQALSGARQFYALGFSILVFMLIIERKYKAATISLIIGMSIHLSLLLIIIPACLVFFNESALKRLHFLTIIIFPIVLMFTNEIIFFMGSAIASEKYSQYGMNQIVGGTLTFIILLEALSLFCYFCIKKSLLKKDSIVKKLYAMVPCFTFFGPLIYANGAMIRISMYFYLYLTLLIPICINNSFTPQLRKFIYVLFILMLMFLILKDGGLVYFFFWQAAPIRTQ